MSAVESLGFHQLFADLQDQGGDSEVRISIFEIAGNKCFDLLQGGHKQIVLKVIKIGCLKREVEMLRGRLLQIMRTVLSSMSRCSGD